MCWGNVGGKSMCACMPCGANVTHPLGLPCCDIHSEEKEESCST